MREKRRICRRYAVCIKNKGNEASLERNKLLVRVIDEDGEDYLYPADWFVAVELPKVVRASLRRTAP
jgi:hypothetical protein